MPNVIWYTLSMKKAYIIVKTAWEYNDQYYENLGGSGYPKQAFLSKESAAKCARKLEIAEIKGCDIAAYGDEVMASIIRDNCEEKLSQIIYGNPSTNWERVFTCLIPQDISDEIANEILDCLTIRWYDIVEVDIDD